MRFLQNFKVISPDYSFKRSLSNINKQDDQFSFKPNTLMSGDDTCLPPLLLEKEVSDFLKETWKGDQVCAVLFIYFICQRNEMWSVMHSQWFHDESFTRPVFHRISVCQFLHPSHIVEQSIQCFIPRGL